MSICTSLDFYFEMGLPMSENQVNKAQSRVASHHLLRWGMGRYIEIPMKRSLKHSPSSQKVSTTIQEVRDLIKLSYELLTLKNN